MDGEAAIAIFREHARAIRGVLLDLNMPGASGEDTFDAIRRIRPDVRIVLISGYSQDRAGVRVANPARAAFLQKPFLPSTLLEAVRALLDA
jgi:DNA-binding response OmpR family regulator